MSMGLFIKDNGYLVKSTVKDNKTENQVFGSMED